MTLMKPIQIQPIGYVKNNLGRRRYNEWRETDSEIIISGQYQDALYRLDEYSHIEVLFYLHEMNRPFMTRIHPTGNSEYPEMGAFATRTPNRPSKIALTTCRLVGIDGNVLRVKGLDGFDGSPVLDIKPYTKKTLSEVRTPDWLNDLNS
ncbi:MAG: tRNA (N6-threonylcarbamoyladenosine(37)-N6)-methyltransferase TrmO [Candidatus Bathyarchaeota archaeon]|nr:tRNA (N6-threonylcarbamoyladenosine(37)-N6)-methyltransferase TrmO [Candidatus Bathyarchaeota archaeon]